MLYTFMDPLLDPDTVYDRGILVTLSTDGHIGRIRDTKSLVHSIRDVAAMRPFGATLNALFMDQLPKVVNGLKGAVGSFAQCPRFHGAFDGRTGVNSVRLELKVVARRSVRFPLSIVFLVCLGIRLPAGTPLDLFRLCIDSKDKEEDKLHEVAEHVTDDGRKLTEIQVVLFRWSES